MSKTQGSEFCLVTHIYLMGPALCVTGTHQQHTNCRTAELPAHLKVARCPEIEECLEHRMSSIKGMTEILRPVSWIRGQAGPQCRIARATALMHNIMHKTTPQCLAHHPSHLT